MSITKRLIAKGHKGKHPLADWKPGTSDSVGIDSSPAVVAGHVATGYQEFLAGKRQLGGEWGFEPLWMPDFLFGFQDCLARWLIRKGRGAALAGCGMGKTILQLVWGENVVRKTNRPVLLMVPLAVGHQTLTEAERFGIDAVRSRDGTYPPGARIVITNYEQLHKFDRHAFVGSGCDEASCLKNYDGKRRAAITEFMREHPYRSLYSATPAPNDYDELGTLAEALGELGYQDMLTRFFRKETKKDRCGWGRTVHKMRKYAEIDFWRWVCSWARACRKPSDLGFDDGPFVLPPLVTREHEVRASRPADGMLFDIPPGDLRGQQEEQRRTIDVRCQKVAELVNHGDPAVCWCHLNPEGDLLEKLIHGAIQIAGADPDEAKEEKLIAFASGQARVLVTKPGMMFGMNWQHCAHQTYFPSHSFEQFYQGVRRSWRFGQTREVVIDVVTSEGGFGVLANLKRKTDQAEAMFARLVELMNEQLVVARTGYGEMDTEVPPWL